MADMPKSYGRRPECIAAPCKAVMERSMPIYEYMCTNCRNIFEKWLKISETTENASCPKCNSEAQHIISNTAFILKGGGWYVTDYGYRKGASEDGAPSSADSSSDSSTTANASEQNADPAPVAAAPSEPASA